MTNTQRLALVAFGLMLGAALGWGVWWLLRPPPCEPDLYTGRMLGYVAAYREPCAVFEWNPRDPGYQNHLVRYNNFGMHDEVTTFDKPAGTYRILILGDSYPQGLQLPREQGFPDLLESRLNETQPGRYEVVNFAIDTIGTDRMLMLYALVAHRFEADLVLVITYVGNDIQNNSIELAALRNEGYSPRPFFKLDEVGNLRLYNWDGTLPGSDAPVVSWLRRAVVSRAYPVKLPETPAVLQTDPYTLEYPVQLGLYLPATAYWEEAWEISGAILGRFAQVTAGQGSQLGLVVIPDRRAVHPADYTATREQYPFLGNYDPLAPVERTLEQAADAGIPAFNTLPTLRVVEQAGGRAYLPVDGHLSPEGHQVLADALYQWLITTFPTL